MGAWWVTKLARLVPYFSISPFSEIMTHSSLMYTGLEFFMKVTKMFVIIELLMAVVCCRYCIVLNQYMTYQIA